MEEKRFEKQDVVTSGSEAAAIEKECGVTEKVSSYNGSVKKAKEWNRTLACKLFEERYHVDGDGMDSLWEKYEMEVKPICKTTKKKKKKKRSEVESYKGVEETDRQYGKMNMISKAIKGIGWLHHVNKKVHNNADR